MRNDAAAAKAIANGGLPARQRGARPPIHKSVMALPMRSSRRTRRKRVAKIATYRRQRSSSDAAEKQHRVLFERNPCPMWICDPKTTKFLDVNEAALRLYGRGRNAFLRMKIRDICLPGRLPGFLRLIRRRKTPAAFIGEWQHVKRDGKVFDAAVTISSIPYARRDARLVQVNNITRRKQVEEALRTSEERLALAASGAKVGMFQWDIATGKVLWTEQTARLLGYKTMTTTITTALSLKCHHRDWVRRIHREDFPRVEAELHRCMARNEPFEVEYRVQWPDQSVHWIAGRGIFQYDTNRKPKQMLGVIMDITKRKRAEVLLWQLNSTLELRVARRTEELASANERLHAIMNNAVLGILTLDERGTIQSINPAIVQIFGYGPDEIIGHNVSKLMASPEQSQQEDFLSHYLQTRNELFGTPSEVLGRRQDSRGIMLELALTEFTENGQRQFAAMLRDITRRKRLQRELLDISERERQRMGHELHDGLGQHLHGLFFLSKLLEKGLQEDASPRAAEIKRLNQHLHDALDLIRGLAHGLQPVKPLPQGLMIALRELAGRTAKLYQIDCRFDCREPVHIQTHDAATHLYRIAQEAVNNAMKHGKPTRIGITLKATPDKIILGITDNGVGFQRRSELPRGMGLHVMQYRADAISGSLAIQRRSQGGTEVVCTATRPTQMAAIGNQTQ